MSTYRSLLNVFAIAITSMFVMSLSSCSNDDDPEINPTTEAKEDQLTYLQSSLVQVDEEGKFTKRVNGFPLTELNADTTVVFVGVESVENAKELFKTWLPQESSITESGNQITFMPTDTLGKAQGTVTFAPEEDPTGKTLASITFSNGAKVPFVSKLNFIKKEAWPHNATSAFEVGEIVQLRHSDTHNYGIYNYVCIKKAEYGQTGILIRISNEKDSGHSLSSMACKSDAYEISRILRSNWNMYANYMAAAGYPNLKNNPNDYYYFNHMLFLGFYVAIYCLNLKTGDEDYHSYGATNLHWLFCDRFGTVS